MNISRDIMLLNYNEYYEKFVTLKDKINIVNNINVNNYGEEKELCFEELKHICEQDVDRILPMFIKKNI